MAEGRAEQVLFAAGEGGYHTYRIPAFLATPRGTLLAFCEGRRDSRSDYGQIDLLLRRSTDGGATWTPSQVVASAPGWTTGNPAPVVDPASGAVVLLFCQNLAEGGEDLICAGKAPRTVWRTRSADEGATWQEPVEITAEVKRVDWTWYATGPCHGVALASGRLLIACDHIVGVRLERHADPHHSHVLLSDDGGHTWRIGGILPEGTNECAAAEIADADGGRRVYINCRNRRGAGDRRAVAWSSDGGESFAGFRRDEALIEPICQGSVATSADGHALYFCNPASTERENLTLRRSDDGGRTWPVAETVYSGCAAYSDLAVLDDGTVLCLYERGVASPYEAIALAREESTTDATDGRMERTETRCRDVPIPIQRQGIIRRL